MAKAKKAAKAKKKIQKKPVAKAKAKRAKAAPKAKKAAGKAKSAVKAKKSAKPAKKAAAKATKAKAKAKPKKVAKKPAKKAASKPIKAIAKKLAKKVVKKVTKAVVKKTTKPAAAKKVAKAAAKPTKAKPEKTPKVAKAAKAKKGSAKPAKVSSAADVVIEKPVEVEVVLTDAEGRRYCRVRDCDQVSTVEGYCRYHYLLFWKKIQLRKRILSEGKLARYIEELTSRYPDKYLEMIRKDLKSEKDFMAAIQELEIDESSVDTEYEDEAQSYIEEVRGISSETSTTTDNDDY